MRLNTSRKLLLVAATDFEIAPFLEHFRLSTATRLLAGNHLTSSAYPRLECLVTGIGPAACAAHLAAIFAADPGYLAIDVGICGAINRALLPLTTVRVTSECFADLGSDEP